MTCVLWIFAVTVVLFMASILFSPAVMIRVYRKKEWHFQSVKIYPWIPFLGALAMTVAGGVRLGDIKASFLSDSSVNPIRILILFLSMTVFSLILDQTGFFGYVSGVMLKKAGNSQMRIFLTLYAVISVLTVFTSNDIVILTFTPFICHFCRSGKINPIPYLMMEFVAANTWSLLLLIGNPTNIYLSAAFEIGFFDYVKVMALPTVAAGLTSLGVMLLLFRKQLKGKVCTEAEEERINNFPLMWVALIHLAACVILLALSQYLGFEMWLISLCMGLSAFLCSVLCLGFQKKSLRPVWQAARRLPFEIVPFVVGMFVLVLALERSGLTARLGNVLSGDPTVFSYGALSFLGSNVLNNIPMSVLFSKILSFGGTLAQVFATVVGSNLGAFLTPVGALAGIMFFNLLKQNGVKMSVGRFVSYGFLIGVSSLAASLAVLEWIF